MIRFRKSKHSRQPRLVMGMVSQVVRDGYGAPLLLSQDEVAHQLSISRTTLWRLVKQGDFQMVHIGSRSFILAASVQDFLARNTIPAEGPVDQ